MKIKFFYRFFSSKYTKMNMSLGLFSHTYYFGKRRKYDKIHDRPSILVEIKDIFCRHLTWKMRFYVIRKSCLALKIKTTRYRFLRQIFKSQVSFISFVSNKLSAKKKSINDRKWRTRLNLLNIPLLNCYNPSLAKIKVTNK